VAREFRLPDIGEGLTEAEIVQWLVPVGSRVDADQPVVEVETDKAVVEIPSPYAGIVLQHGGAEGEVIAVGSVLVVIGDEDEPLQSAHEMVSPAKSASETATSSRRVVSSATSDPAAVWATTPAPIVGTLSDEAEILEPTPSPVPESRGPVKALPVVRKLARDNGVDIETIVGSGPGGRVTRDDVEAAVARHVPDQPATAPIDAKVDTGQEAVSSTMDTAHPPGSVDPETQTSIGVKADERRAMTRLRRTIAINMSKSWAEIPHVTTFDDVDATRLLEVRRALGQRHHTKVPIEALVIRALAPALRAFPDFNSTVDGDELVIHGSHDIGIAVDTPDGLLVAVIRDADSKGVLELADEITRLGVGAKERKLGPDELTGQTFTISNIGALGGGHGTPIVPYGTTAILSVGRAREKAVVYDGDLVIAPVMALSLSYDHRVIDGGQGRRFMTMIMENLEEPALFLT
jgi:pyruvate dehydrogenase E2 component (dihydrolipoamide acetyltransferase)